MSAALAVERLSWHGPLVALARPILAQIVGGTISFVEVRSTDEAIARADRAEEVAALQRGIVRGEKVYAASTPDTSSSRTGIGEKW